MELLVPDWVILARYADDIAAIPLGRDSEELHMRVDVVMLLIKN